MAERRMFAKSIIDSDAFMDMPLSAQALYFQLGMRADDDGFVNNSKRIQRMIGASEEDLAILINRKFLIMFDSGVMVIKHWKINNYIRSDRYKGTNYIEEKSKLKVKNNGAYTTGIPDKEEVVDNRYTNEDIFMYYENSINQLSPRQYEKLNEWINVLDESIVKYAIDKASDSNKRSFGYIEGILKSWKGKGYKTLSDAMNEKANKKENTLPEWFGKEIEVEAMSEEEMAELDKMLEV